MANFATIAFLDTWPLVATLRQRQSLFASSDDEVRIVPLRSDGAALYPDWKSAANVLSRISRLHDAFEIEEASLEMLMPGAVSGWHKGRRQLGTLHLPLVTNPAALVYSGPESLCLPVGVLTWVNTALPHCDTNFGLFPRVHLVVEFRAKPAVETED